MALRRASQGGRAGARRPRVLAPVVGTRAVPEMVRLLLFVRSGGRCEFDGCNKYLMEHPLTLTGGNFAQVAHIVAFRPDGPRGRDGHRPRHVHSADNLMLMCPPCHKLIDDHPERFTRQTLEEYKAAHEARVRHLTELGPERKTAILVFRALVRDQTVTMPFDQIAEATAPRYPSTTHPLVIDLTAVSGDGESFYRTACDTIKRRVGSLLGPEGEGAKAGHISVFALGPIPLLICLGRQLSNKVATDLFQRHRDTERWTWKARGRRVAYSFRRVRTGRGKAVALVLSLSGKIDISSLPGEFRDATIYEITLRGQSPTPTFLRRRRDLDAFRTVYQDAIAEITKTHKLPTAISLFPAVPAPIAVLCGRELLPKVHPKLRIFDYDRATGGFSYKLEV